MSSELQGKKVAILVEEGFEQVELTRPQKALENKGAEVVVISPKQGKVKAWHDTSWGDEFTVDVQLKQANADDYDVLVLPGGVKNPDALRTNEDAQKFIRAFVDAGKLVAAICHAPWVLIDSDVIDGRTLTSYPSLKLDLKNAGANWVDKEVVFDRGLITSRNIDDIPAFNEKIIEEMVKESTSTR